MRVEIRLLGEFEARVGGLPVPAVRPREPSMKAGDVARRTRRVSRRDIELCTEMTGARNPLHYDEGLAGASRFGGPIVQGGVTTGLLNAVVAEDRRRLSS